MDNKRLPGAMHARGLRLSPTDISRRGPTGFPMDLLTCGRDSVFDFAI